MKKETYCLLCRKYTENNNPKIVRNRQNRLMIQSNCAICGSKKSRFIKEQQAMGILSNLGIKTPLSKVPLLNILFYYNLKRCYQEVLFVIIKSLHSFRKDLVGLIV